jgi:glycosyltransferase involved in cell wall biosynthesis
VNLKLVSIMMPAYNAERFIGQAIESVLVQSYPNWELIVVNDGSTDNTAEVVAGYSDSRIRLLHQPNGGESAARNTALKNMHGELVAFLDADDQYLPHHLESTVSFLEEHLDYEGVYTDGYYCDATGNLLQTLTSRRRGPFQGDVFAEAVRGSDLFGPPVSVVVRRDPIVNHHLRFDEEIVIGPDWVFLTQFAEVGLFGYLGETTCLYRIHDSNISLQVDLKKRAREFAKCRIRQLEMARYDECPVDVRSFVFYDLLVNLLRGQPAEQTAVMERPHFKDLPASDQARLLRLTAAQALLSSESEQGYISRWFEKSIELDATERRTSILFNLYKISPKLARRSLQLKRNGEVDILALSPFADMDFSAEPLELILN